MVRVFDCFTFFNEIEMLEFRIKEMWDGVDFFLVCESDLTFQGESKPLFFKESEARFAPYAEKIIHHVVSDMPRGTDNWAREHHQRNAIRVALVAVGIESSDVAIISDVDEIISREALVFMRSKPGYFQIQMKMYQFFMNQWVPGHIWTKAYAGTWGMLNEVEDLSGARIRQSETLAKFGVDGHVIENGGWHFTFLGGVDRVREKVASYSHTDEHISKLRSLSEAERALKIGFDLGGRRLTRFVEIDDSFPVVLRESKEYYEKIGFCKPASDRIRELEEAYELLHNQSEREKMLAKRVLGKSAEMARLFSRFLDPWRSAQYSEGKFSFAGENLIKDSSGFEVGWVPGAQRERACISADVPPAVLNWAVMKHTRERWDDKKDNNVGWFQVRRDRLKQGCLYLATCFVWLPRSSGITRIYLDITGCDTRTNGMVDFGKREAWQKVTASIYCGERAFKAVHSILGLALRMDGEEPCTAYSAAWSLRLDDRALQDVERDDMTLS